MWSWATKWAQWGWTGAVRLINIHKALAPAPLRVYSCKYLFLWVIQQVCFFITYENKMDRKSHSKTADISTWLCSLLLRKAIYFECGNLWVQVKITIKEVTHKILKLPPLSSVSTWRPPPWMVSRVTVSDSRTRVKLTFLYAHAVTFDCLTESIACAKSSV